MTGRPSPPARSPGGPLAVVRRGVWLAGAAARWTLIGLIRLYRATLSGMLGGQCRFEPSCSAYAEEAVRVRGAIRGTGLAAWRILRCGPFTRGGPDPVRAGRGSSGRSGGSPAYDAVALDGGHGGGPR